MHKSVKWSKFAEQDLEIILHYLSTNWNPTVCLNFLKLIDISIEMICINPNVFILINKKLEIRKCIVSKQNSLYFRVKNNQIEILRIYDNRQNPNKLIL
jgi:plasmid stabilization system protein ParE